ncbi:hypothetical protein ACWC3X_23385 [Streptomyces populi]
MSRLRRLTSGVGVASAVGAALLCTASPASAQMVDAVTEPSGSFIYQAGSIYYESYGDHFGVCDNFSDGAGVLGYWKTGSDGTVHTIYDGKGVGECAYETNNVPETSYVYIKVCLRDDGAVLTATCSGWEKQYAGSPL